MQIDVPERWKINHPLGDDPAVTHYHDGVRVKHGKLRSQLFIVLDFLRLGYNEPKLQRPFFDRRGREFQATSAWLIGLSDDQANRETGVYQSFQRWYGKTRSAAENKSDRVVG